MSTSATAEAWLRRQPYRPCYWDTADHASAFLNQVRLTDLYARTRPVASVLPVFPVLTAPDPAEAEYFDDGSPLPEFNEDDSLPLV
jgi:hypothetical protein